MKDILLTITVSVLHFFHCSSACLPRHRNILTSVGRTPSNGDAPVFGSQTSVFHYTLCDAGPPADLGPRPDGERLLSGSRRRSWWTCRREILNVTASESHCSMDWRRPESERSASTWPPWCCRGRYGRGGGGIVDGIFRERPGVPGDMCSPLMFSVK